MSAPTGVNRARAVPLFVRGPVETRNVHLMYDVLYSSPGIQEIDITASLHGFQALTKALVKPHLDVKSLTLVILGHRNNGEIVHQDIRHAPSFPSLTNLELHRCPFTFVSPRYTRLTQLSLYSLPASERPKFEDFLATLARYPQLQHLTLVDALPLPITPGSPMDSTKCIRLPMLKTLTLEGPILEVSQLLDHLILPQNVRITCAINHLNGPNNDHASSMKRLARALTFHLNNPRPAASTASRLSPSPSPSPPPSFHKLVMSCREESFRFMNAQARPNPIFGQQLRIRGYYAHSSWENAALDLVFNPDSHCHEDEVYMTWLLSVWKALPVHYLHTLALQNVELVTQKIWAKLLKPLANLQVLEINGYPPSGLAWALLLDAMESEDEEPAEFAFGYRGSTYSTSSSITIQLRHPQTLLVPHLCDILLYDVDCISGGYMLKPGTNANSYTDLDDSRFLDVLMSAFRQRHGVCQVTLRSLRLYQCRYVPKRTLRELRRCVSSVFWDHRGALDEEEYAASVQDMDVRSVRSAMTASTTTLGHYSIATPSVRSGSGSSSSGSSSGGGVPARYRKICMGLDAPECRHFNRLVALQDQSF
ncbi:hypothetical protein AX16_003964 [Volvariella volvacea WC 439]|nr:hypothetical protein AX16_003964 [Volvariella volvacea WC 439]